MLLKERVKLLRLENQDLAARILEMQEELNDISQRFDHYARMMKGYTDTAVKVEIEKLEGIVQGVIDAVNNQHKSLREEKAELETKYVKVVSALKFLLTSSSSGDVFTPPGLCTYIMKVLGEINE